jgi:hypothetical protein
MIFSILAILANVLFLSSAILAVISFYGEKAAQHRVQRKAFGHGLRASFVGVGAGWLCAIALFGFR